MTKGANRPHLLRLLPLLAATVAAAVLFSGCLWGVVTDADTGDPLPGVTVNYVDANGVAGSAVTDANGMYVIDQAAGPVPAFGPISFQINEPGFEPMTAARLIEYDNNPNASVANLSSFWEVQSFELVPELVQRVEVQLPNVDVDHVAPTANPLAYLYAVDFKVYENPADPSAGGCQSTSPLQPTAAGDPAPVTLNYGCGMVGDDFRVLLTVTLVRHYQELVPLPVPHLEPRADSSVSTAAYDWVAPSPNTDWQTVTINSNDATGPDSPNIRFEAQIRFRAVLGRPPAYVSDINLKESFAPIDRRQILQRLVALPITSWRYIGEAASVRHVGPMAQDFRAAFGLGDSDRYIETVDAYGVAFAAIQELHEMLTQKDRQIATLQRQVADLTARIAALEERLGR